MVLHWETAFELGTAGFHVERLEPIRGDYERLNDTLLPALITSPRGGRYTFLDPDAWPRETYSYRLVEQEVWGGTRIHGPYRVTPVEPRQPLAKVASAQELPASHADQGYADPAQGYRLFPTRWLAAVPRGARWRQPERQVVPRAWSRVRRRSRSVGTICSTPAPPNSPRFWAAPRTRCGAG